MNAELRDVLELLNQPRTRSQYGGADDMVTDLLRERAEIAERLAALSRPVVPDSDGERLDWQPIETAPKHEPILMLMKHGAIQGTWDGETGSGYYWRPMEWYATHWMPLPAPPAARSAEEK